MRKVVHVDRTRGSWCVPQCASELIHRWWRREGVGGEAEVQFPVRLEVQSTSFRDAYRLLELPVVLPRVSWALGAPGPRCGVTSCVTWRGHVVLRTMGMGRGILAPKVFIHIYKSRRRDIARYIYIGLQQGVWPLAGCFNKAVCIMPVSCLARTSCGAGGVSYSFSK